MRYSWKLYPAANVLSAPRHLAIEQAAYLRSREPGNQCSRTENWDAARLALEADLAEQLRRQLAQDQRWMVGPLATRLVDFSEVAWRVCLDKYGDHLAPQYEDECNWYLAAIGRVLLGNTAGADMLVRAPYWRNSSVEPRQTAYGFHELNHSRSADDNWHLATFVIRVADATPSTSSRSFLEELGVVIFNNPLLALRAFYPGQYV